MILEPLELNISPELFDEHFLDFIADFSGVTFNKIELSKFRHRYIIYRANIDEEEKFGEIERIPVQDEKLEVKVAIVEFEGSSHNFFHEFYRLVADKWGYVPWMYHDDLGHRLSLIPNLVRRSLFSLYQHHHIPISDYGFRPVDEYREELSAPTGDPDEDYRRKSLLDDIDRGLPPIEAYEKSTKRSKKGGGRPGLSGDELVYRLKKAQDAEELKKKNPEMTWGEIAVQINWNRGGSPDSSVHLLKDARARLMELNIKDTEGLLKEVAQWKEKK